ncbi:uncharacterized protein LOC123320024 [Coccinella septempunctata]|uniref:uncharacterized protein LOC123320024 n=1 Tax=Coccinella septempunctata TaxID=41139 RepID=UPI001D08A91F|nr:uncharacterized protein LOC123320024 [Coccinella septempunctata]
MAAGTCLTNAASVAWILTVFFAVAKGGCTFNKTWSGRWFQSGLQNLVFINSTHIETKGECFENQADKYLVYNRQDNCYRCLAIHEKFTGVLQYKESICEEKKGSLSEICSSMLGDDPLHTMFRKYPETKSIPCPFKSAPFTFSYSRGAGECSNPPSKAESCTDDSRIVFKYQACPDVPSTESNVEELVCLATWKEGSTRYLIGKISQGNRRNLITDEDQYRCFIYQRDKSNDKTTYSIAQSADATCTGIINSYEGSKTMKLTTVDNHHNRCKFPKWITDHHTWLSLDHKKIYKFTQRNATLKIVDEVIPKPKRPIRPNFSLGSQSTAFGYEEFGFESQDQRRSDGEMRVICHGILESQDQKRVQIVAHITSGCDSGYVCMVFHKRDTNVIEIQQTSEFEENPDDACRKFNPSTTLFTTLVTTTLHTKKCPHFGRYKVPPKEELPEERRKKREQSDSQGSELTPECLSQDYETLTVGCTNQHEMEFKSGCNQQMPNAYSCHGSWNENSLNFIIATPVTSKKSVMGEPIRYCFIYTLGYDSPSHQAHGDHRLVQDKQNSDQAFLKLSRVTDSCHRIVVPGFGNWAYNFTNTGACKAADQTNSGITTMPAYVLLLTTICLILNMR